MTKKYLTFRLNLFLIFILCLFSFFSLNTVPASDNGTTAANFLKLGTGARITAMAEAGSSIVSDSNGIFWNPASIAFLENADIQTTYLNYLSDIHFSNFGFVKPLSFGAFGFSGTSVFSNDLEGRNELDHPTGNFSFYNWAFSMTHARKFHQNLSAGCSLKLIRESIDTEVADGIAFDIGFLYQYHGLGLKDNLSRFSAVLQNIGPNFGPGKNSPLPTYARLGISNSFFEKTWNNELDLLIPFRGQTEIDFGNEWWIHKNLAFRGGYRFLRGDYAENDWFKSLTGGFGIYFIPASEKQQYNIDYSFSSSGNIGSEHYISFGVKFP